jgi:hypothetical protein
MERATKFSKLKWQPLLSGRWPELSDSAQQVMVAFGMERVNSLRTEGILRKLQNLMKLTQMWTDFENNETT